MQKKKTKEKIKILVVDDSSTNLTLLQGILHYEEYKILTANNGFKAIQIFASENPDLILLDIMMPRMNGLTLIEKLKELTRNLPPIIIISARSEILEAQKAMELGIIDYIKKPIDIQALIKKVEEIAAPIIEKKNINLKK